MGPLGQVGLTCLWRAEGLLPLLPCQPEPQGGAAQDVGRGAEVRAGRLGRLRQLHRAKLNKAGVKVERTPWCDGNMSRETSLIADKLSQVNKLGVLTINSQPSAHCVPSDDEVLGWGNPGGYVFQKAYLEFFTSEENVLALLQVLGRWPGVNFQVVNQSGLINYTNIKSGQPIAVTWGVFPGQEIVQPTIVDPLAFDDWRPEAFGLWVEQWGKLYDAESTSRKIIENISETYYLVNLVDIDFPKGNCLWEVMEDMFSRRKLNDTLVSKTSLFDWIEQRKHQNYKFKQQNK